MDHNHNMEDQINNDNPTVQDQVPGDIDKEF